MVSERFGDWSSKFGPLGLKCLEVTGDTEEEEYGGITSSQVRGGGGVSRVNVVVTSPLFLDDWIQATLCLNQLELNGEISQLENSISDHE